MNLDKAMKNIHEDWKPFFDENRSLLASIFNNIYFNNDDTIFPKVKNLFRIFKYMSPTEIKVLLLGQDPYIGSEQIDGEKIPQAEGLSFSVPKSHRKIPPSLKNIYKEIQNSYPDCEFINGNLKRWVTKEFIFLLNSSLTDCVFEVKRDTSKLEANNLFKEASESYLKDILGYEEAQLVSADYVNDDRSAVVDASSTMVINKRQLKVYAWYDNEIAYAKRMVDIFEFVSSCI